MKRIQIFGMGIFLTIVLIMLGCKAKEESEGAPEGSLTGKETTPGAYTFSIPDVEETYWQVLAQLQDSIVFSPQDSLLRKKLCEQAYFEKNRAIVVVGIGRLRNPQTGQVIPRGYAQQAAFSSAARWAAYVQTWLENQYHPEFGSISTALTSPSQVVKEIVQGDSLILEVAFQVDNSQ